MMQVLRSIFKPTPTPTPEQKKVVRELGGEVAWSESRLFMGDIPKYNPDELIGRHGAGIYKKMMRDEQVKAVVKFKRDAITSRDWYFDYDEDVPISDAEKDRRVSMYTEMLHKMQGSFSDGLNFIMKGQWQGFSLTEKIVDVFEFEGRPWLGLRRLAPKPFDTFLFVTDDFGEIIRCEQEMDGKRQTIDLSKFVYFVCNPEMDQHYGQSDLREAYRSWYIKDVAIKFHAQFLERLAGGLVVAKPTEGHTLPVNSPEYQALKGVVDHIRSMSSIVLPSHVMIEMLSPKSTDAFEKAVTMHDLAIAKALLVPNLLGVTHQGDTGSYSQADVQLEAFMWTLDADASRLADCANEQIFDPLGELNFADGLSPKFHFKPVSESKKLNIIGKWNEMVQAGSVEASDTDEAHLRELMEFPEKGEPLKKTPEPTEVDPTGPQDRPRRIGQGGQDETVRSAPPVRITSNAAMSRALRRVSFSVIDRSSRDIEDSSVEPVEDKLAEMLSFVVGRIREEKLGTPAGDVSAIGTLDFRKSDKSRVRREIDSILQKSWNLGLRHARDEISRARGESFSIDMGRIDDNASAFLKVNGFKMMGNLTDHMRSIVQNTLINGVKFSWTTDEIVRRIYDNLTKSGMISMRRNALATGRLEDEVAEALEDAGVSLHRIRTAIRTNAFQAINEARYSAFTDPELGDFVEALEYSAILDSRTTDICSSLDGRIHPIDSPEWNRIRPPNHYNCRSILVPVTVVDSDVEGKDRDRDSRWSKPSLKDPQQGFGGQTG